MIERIASLRLFVFAFASLRGRQYPPIGLLRLRRRPRGGGILISMMNSRRLTSVFSEGRILRLKGGIGSTAHVRFGSSTDLKVPKSHFRSTPRSGHACERQLCARSGRSDLLALAPNQTLVVGAPFSSLLANHHRLPGYKRLDARTAKSRLAHPIGALRPAVTEPGVGPQQHIQA